MISSSSKGTINKMKASPWVWPWGGCGGSPWGRFCLSQQWPLERGKREEGRSLGRLGDMGKGLAETPDSTREGSCRDALRPLSPHFWRDLEGFWEVQVVRKSRRCIWWDSVGTGCFWGSGLTPGRHQGPLGAIWGAEGGVLRGGRGEWAGHWVRTAGIQAPGTSQRYYWSALLPAARWG